MTYYVSPGESSHQYKNAKHSERPKRSYIHKTHRNTKSFYPKHDTRLYLSRTTSQDSELLECRAKASRETTDKQYPWDILNAEFSTLRGLDSTNHYHLGSLRIRIAMSSPFGFNYPSVKNDAHQSSSGLKDGIEWQDRKKIKTLIRWICLMCHVTYIVFVWRGRHCHWSRQSTRDIMTSPKQILIASPL